MNDARWVLIVPVGYEVPSAMGIYPLFFKISNYGALSVQKPERQVIPLRAHGAPWVQLPLQYVLPVGYIRCPLGTNNF